MRKAFPFSTRTRRQLHAALLEDVGKGDVTSKLLIPPRCRGRGVVRAREKGVFCGEPVVRELCRLADRNLKVTLKAKDGCLISKNEVVIGLAGRVISILKVERTLLNFLGHLCGIATLTRQFTDRVKKYPVSILDTRKTTPLWRELEKYAVRIGGGQNHRMGLYDAIFVKENHRPFGNLAKLRQRAGGFEIEVRNILELREAFKLKPRVILFDNFTPSHLRQAVRLARNECPGVILEASGNIHLTNVAQYAATGVDWISVGALTHSIPALNFSLLIE